jgi:hypothetical protein
MVDTVRKPEKGDNPDAREQHEEAPLKGTFVSVMILGGFLALTWLLVFILFIARN